VAHNQGTPSAVVGKTLIYGGDIDEEFLSFLWQNLLKAGADLWGTNAKAKEDRRLVLCSTGGSPEVAFIAVDLFEHVQSLTTVATGSCMSAAIIVIAAGTPGSRLATPRTRFMIHSPSWDLGATTRKQAEVQSKELRYIEKVYADVLAKYTKKPSLFWIAKQRLDEGYFFGVDEAIEFGIIDQVVKAPF